MKIFIFNPESDYALADFSDAYNPPEAVKELRADSALTQHPLCAPGDAILVLDNIMSDTDEDPSTFNSRTPDESPDTLSLASGNQIPILRLADLRHIFTVHSAEHITFEPWGWNPAIRHTLIRAGVPDNILPDMEYLKKLRMLSHRRTTIAFNKYMNEEFRSLPDTEFLISPLPNEFFDIDWAMNMYHDLKKDNKDLFVKQPWSSAGRGVFFTYDIHMDRVRQWMSGAIRRQGSVICETAAHRKLDFATEWIVDEAGYPPRFLGFSVFKTNRRGGYESNVRAPQSQLIHLIKEAAPKFNPDLIVDIQRKALSKVIFESGCPYKGYIGIDMLVDETGAIRACIEINFRCTMGVINLIDDDKPYM